MLTQGEDVEAHALRQRGWSISAIARHLDRDRKTVRAYLNGDRQPGKRASSTPDPLERFEPYLRARFADDCHLWATACSTRSSRSATTVPIRRSSARSGNAVCGRTAKRVVE